MLEADSDLIKQTVCKTVRVTPDLLVPTEFKP